MEQKYHFPKARLITVIVFAIAMAFIEAAVVVYLRELYYPEGFSFPLKMIPIKIYAVELGREAATIVMLAAIGWLSAKSFLSRFASFMMAFGIWDIFYYVFLKITLNWPASIIEWDLLFLIPLPWVGPVIAPVIVSIFLIVAGVFIWSREAQQNPIIVSKWHWILEGLAGLIIIGSFLTNAKAMINLRLPKEMEQRVFQQIRSLKKRHRCINNSDSYLSLFATGQVKYRCHAPKISIRVEPDGNVTNCLDRKNPIGNVYKQRLQEIITSKRMKKLQRSAESCCSCVDSGVVESSFFWDLNFKTMSDMLRLFLR